MSVFLWLLGPSRPTTPVPWTWTAAVWLLTLTAGKRLSRVPGLPLPLQSSPSACYWPSCRREREKHCSQHFSEGETTERSLEGKLPVMRLGLLWECCVSAWSCHQFSQISFWKGHKCSEGLKFEDWDTAKLWVQVVSQNDLTQTTHCEESKEAN